MSTALTTRPDAGFLIIDTFDQAKSVADYINKSALVPDAYRGKPADIVIAMQYGMELGLSPMQALQSVAVVNGRPSLWGDALPGLIIGLPDCEGIDSPEPEGDDEKLWKAVCTVQRRGRPPTTRSFSYKDAVTAGLWGANTWKKYPKRMLMMRARAFAIRDAYPDRMKGIITAEEAIDITPVAPPPSEPRRLSETAPATPAPPVAPVDAAAVPTPPTPAAAVSTSPAASGEAVWSGVKVLDTKWVEDGAGGYAEITTNKGVMMTRDKPRYDEAATAEGSDTLLKATYRFGKRMTRGKEERVVLLMKLELDEPEQPALLDGEGDGHA